MTTGKEKLTLRDKIKLLQAEIDDHLGRLDGANQDEIAEALAVCLRCLEDLQAYSVISNLLAAWQTQAFESAFDKAFNL